MKDEINTAAEFIISLLPKPEKKKRPKHGKLKTSDSKLTDKQIDTVRKSLVDLMHERISSCECDYQNPMRGNAYRALWTARGFPDELIRKAAKFANIPSVHLLLPTDFVIWIDPCDVSYRLGDYGTVLSLGIKSPLSAASSNSSSSYSELVRTALRADAKEFVLHQQNRREHAKRENKSNHSNSSSDSTLNTDSNTQMFLKKVKIIN